MKMFLIIGSVFSLRGLRSHTVCSMSLSRNDLLHCVIGGMYVYDWLDMVLEIDGTGQRT